MPDLRLFRFARGIGSPVEFARKALGSIRTRSRRRCSGAGTGSYPRPAAPAGSESEEDQEHVYTKRLTLPIHGWLPKTKAGRLHVVAQSVSVSRRNCPRSAGCSLTASGGSHCEVAEASSKAEILLRPWREYVSVRVLHR